jgi:hypothetical protein
MKLSVRHEARLIPSYSLTGDVLSYARCGLQYRLGNVGNLPSTRPVQLWFGQFLHGSLEEAYRRYQETGSIPDAAETKDLAELVARRLAAQGLRARNAELENTANWRVELIVRELGPALFPLIRHAEVRLTSTRALGRGTAPARYQMTGVVDVITHVELIDPHLADNPIVAAVADHLPPGLAGTFEVIVDYKGTRRPPIHPPTPGQHDFAQIYEWQVLTYADLRARQPDALPVVAGVLLYLNELGPTWRDLRLLRDEVDNRLTDIAPEPGSETDIVMRQRPPRTTDTPTRPSVPFEFRLSRAIHVVPTTQRAIRIAGQRFDGFAKSIEDAKEHERSSGSMLNSWTEYADDDQTCVACDFRVICPSRAEKRPVTPDKTPA